MKTFLPLLAAFASTATAFSVTRPSVSRNTVVLNGSRKAQKIVSRSKWAESRGGMAADSSDGDSAAAGLMTNEHGLEFVKLVHPDTGATSEVYLYGGVVTSYIDGEGTEVGQV